MSRPTGPASSAAKKMPTKMNAARMPPCRHPASAAAAITKIAKIQMDMTPLKIILQKMHDENAGSGTGVFAKPRFGCQLETNFLPLAALIYLDCSRGGVS
jgi:hypothetical protein